MVEKRIHADGWVLLVTAAVAACCAGGEWLAQLSCYPLWRQLKSGKFASYYAAWSRNYWGFFFAPLALLLAGAFWITVRRPADFPEWCAPPLFLLQLLTVLMAVWFSPSRSGVLTATGALNVAAYARLLRMHWLSIAITTVNAVVLFWTVKHVFLPGRPGEPQSGFWLIAGTTMMALTGLWAVWLVQQFCYRLWPHVSKTDFDAYHVAWWRSMWTSLFIPAGLALGGWVSLIWVRPVDRDLARGRVLRLDCRLVGTSDGAPRDAEERPFHGPIPAAHLHTLGPRGSGDRFRPGYICRACRSGSDVNNGRAPLVSLEQ